MSDDKGRELCEIIKRDMYPRIRKEVEDSYMQQKTLMLRDRQETQGDAGMDDALIVWQHHDKDVVARHDGAISDLYGHGGVKAMLTHYGGTLKCAIAWVYYPDLDGDNVPLKSGYLMCCVPEIKLGFCNFSVKNVVGNLMSRGLWKKDSKIKSNGHEKK
ncbi:hypothetical protein D1007_61962 [Hordeum vulgare]|nr:hypothetical protein D1007_61962 [Hordeum vulgare]